MALASGCAQARTTASAAEVADRRVRVVTTTNLITDLAREVGGRRVEVTGLMGPGVDPHLYKATAGDVRVLVEADLILYGGLELEGKMEDVFAKLARQRPTVAVTNAMPRSRLRSEPGFADRYDPHVWFDVDLWRHAVRATRDALADVDPVHRETYARNAAAYDAELVRLDRWVAEQVATIPAARRVLVTSHDAFQYFGERYDVDVVAIQGISEGVLVDLHTALAGRPSMPEAELEALGTRSRRALRRGLRALSARDGNALVLRRDGSVSLTDAGRTALGELDERRRWWAAWLEHGAALDLADAREADPRDLDASLGEDAVRHLRELDAERAAA